MDSEAARAVEAAGEADVEHRVPVFVGDLANSVVADDAGVVDQHVQVAEVLDDGGDQAFTWAESVTSTTSLQTLASCGTTSARTSLLTSASATTRPWWRFIGCLRS